MGAARTPTIGTPDLDGPSGGAPSDTAVDVLGALLLTGCASWSLYAASGRDAHPEGVLLGLLAVAAGYAAGRIAGAVAPVGSPAVIAVAVGVLALVAPGGLSGDPAAPPLHDADANGALIALAVGAACCAAQTARATGPGLRHVRPALLLAALALLACALTVEAVTTGSTAAVLACLGIVILAVAVRTAGRRLPALLLLGLCAALAVAAPLLLARSGADLTARGGGLPLSEQRAALWHDAVQEAGREPLRGVGPGRFTELSPAAQDFSTPGGPSSAALEVAAEQGVPGLCLLIASYGWMMWTLRRAPGPTSTALTAAGALTALAVEAAISPVLSFPGITAGAGPPGGLGRGAG
ncbi:O-antigen ligase family protein, partial [Streptacidiphilus carbonis]|uniref:O-antigen ligase family protein n=1 Tax=Streptacidiphilus carbonis TaxID=105422 RepID=UPI000694C839